MTATSHAARSATALSEHGPRHVTSRHGKAGPISHVQTRLCCQATCAGTHPPLFALPPERAMASGGGGGGATKCGVNPHPPLLGTRPFHRNSIVAVLRPLRPLALLGKVTVPPPPPLPPQGPVRGITPQAQAEFGHPPKELWAMSRVHRRQAAQKHRKKMGSSVAYKTIGTVLSQNMGHEDACGWVTEMQSGGCAAVRQWPTLSFTHRTC